MSTKWTEEEMRQALFGNGKTSAPVCIASAQEAEPDFVATPAPKMAEKKVSRAFTPRLRVTLRVSNEFEGKTFEIVHDADTLSTLLAEQQATKAAKKKFRYVEVISVKST